MTCHWQSRVAPHNTAHPHCPFALPLLFLDPPPVPRVPVGESASVRRASRGGKRACQWHFKLPVTTSRRGGADLSGRRAELGDWGPDSGGANLARNSVAVNVTTVAVARRRSHFDVLLIHI